MGSLLQWVLLFFYPGLKVPGSPVGRCLKSHMCYFIPIKPSYKTKGALSMTTNCYHFFFIKHIFFTIGSLCCYCKGHHRSDLLIASEMQMCFRRGKKGLFDVASTFPCDG